jgi:hypothetical protein
MDTSAHLSSPGIAGGFSWAKFPASRHVRAILARILAWIEVRAAARADASLHRWGVSRPKAAPHL